MKGRRLATGLLAGLAGVVAAPALGEAIEIRHQGQHIDFGMVMSTTLPGEIAPQSARFQVRTDFEDGGAYEYLVDFPEEVRLDGADGRDHATVGVSGPRAVQRESTPGGRDVHTIELEAEVTRVPQAGGLYEGILPVTVNVTVEP